MEKEINLLFLADEYSDLGMIRSIFSEEPFGAFVTVNQDKALEILHTGKIKIVVCDQVLPRLNGSKFLHEVLSYDSLIERILLAAPSDFTESDEANNVVETHRVLRKPWKSIDLLRGVRRAIERYDLTRRAQEANEQLKRMYEARVEFTSIVSHELRTPLASIKVAIDLVFKKMLGPINEEQEEVLDRAKKNVDRLKRLIDDILDLTKMESGKLNMNFTKGDILQVIREVVEIQKDFAKTRGLYVRTNFDQVPPIVFDSDRIVQVLNNFISNAIKFTKQGGITIKVTNKSKEGHVLISIIDTGKGISEENVNKLFQKFYQVESAHENEEGGTGLGLAICKEIILLHHGDIWVESVLEKGSTFNFTLPITP